MYYGLVNLRDDPLAKMATLLNAKEEEFFHQLVRLAQPTSAALSQLDPLDPRCTHNVQPTMGGAPRLLAPPNLPHTLTHHNTLTSAT